MKSERQNEVKGNTLVHGAVVPSEASNNSAVTDPTNRHETSCDCWSEIHEFNLPIEMFFNWLGGLATSTEKGVQIHGANFGAMLQNFVTEMRETEIKEHLAEEPKYWIFPIQGRGEAPDGIVE